MQVADFLHHQRWARFGGLARFLEGSAGDEMNAYEYAQTNMQRSSLNASLAFPKAIDHVSAVQHLFEQVEWAVIVVIRRLIGDRGIVSSNHVLALG